MPRTTYINKNRYWPRSKLSEYELVRLLWFWCSGVSANQSAKVFQENNSDFDEFFSVFEKDMIRREISPIEKTEIRPISRQTFKKYNREIAEHLFWDVFRYDDDLEFRIDKVIRYVEMMLKKKRYLWLIRIVKGYVPKGKSIRETALIHRIGKTILSKIQSGEMSNNKDFYKEVLCFKYWFMMSNNQNYAFQRLHGILPAELLTGEATYRFSRRLYADANGVMYKDMPSYCFLLGLQGHIMTFCIAELFSPKERRSKIKELDRKFVENEKLFNKFMVYGGVDELLAMLQKKPPP